MEQKQPRHINLATIDILCDCYGLQKHNPFVAVIDLKQVQRQFNNVEWHYGLYAVWLKNNKACSIRYGLKELDYDEGTVVTFAPGTKVEVQMPERELPSDAIGILFHPDIIYGTLLGEQISGFNFFHYSQREALHLSEEERAIFLRCASDIRRETEMPRDRHSDKLIANHLLLLLQYLNRFYDRQFETRHATNSDVVVRFENNLQNYFISNKAKNGGVPTVAYFAKEAGLTAGYFGDLVKRELGITAQEIITNHVMNLAKQRLIDSNDDVAIIAYDLGFKYPQHFTRLFKNTVGKSPTQFRKS